MLVAQLAIGACAVAAWLARGRPLEPLASSWRKRGALRGRLTAGARAHRSLAALLAVTAIALAVEAFLAVALPPNSWDSMMYHLSRSAQWIQEGSVFGIGGTTYETQYQANGELLYSWTMLLSDGDRLAALVQWVAAIGSGIVVYCGARMLSFSRSASLFAGALFLTMPQIVVQASSTLVDVPAAFFAASFALFAVRAVAGRTTGDLIVAALALGLAIGTKSTFLLALPGIALIIGAAVVRWRPPRGWLIRAAAVLLVGAVALGSWKYIDNLSSGVGAQGKVGEDALRHSTIPHSAGKLAWSFVDLPGLEGTLPASLTQRVHDKIWAAGEDPFNDTFVSEDGIGYGPLGFLLLLPLLVYFAIRRRPPPSRRLVAIASGSFFILAAVVLEVFSNASHVLVTGVLLGAPLLALAYEIPWMRHTALLLATFTLAPVLFQNALKPLYPDSALDLDRAEVQGLQHDFAPALARADEVLPVDARIAFVGPRFATWDYPFYGPHFDRYVLRIEADSEDPPPADEIDALIADNDLDAVVFAGIDPPAGMRVRRLGDIAFSETVVAFPRRPSAARNGG